MPCNFSQNDKHTRPFFNIFLKNYLSPSLSFSLKHSGRFYYTENKDIKSIKQKVWKKKSRKEMLKIIMSPEITVSKAYHSKSRFLLQRAPRHVPSISSVHEVFSACYCNYYFSNLLDKFGLQSLCCNIIYLQVWTPKSLL